MIIYDEIFSYLQTVEAVTDLVAERIYPLGIPDDASLPLVVMSQSGSDEETKLNGASATVRKTITLEVHADTLASMVNVTAALNGALRGKRSIAIGSLHCASIDRTDESDNSYFLESEGKRVYVRATDYRLRISEPQA